MGTTKISKQVLGGRDLGMAQNAKMGGIQLHIYLSGFYMIHLSCQIYLKFHISQTCYSQGPLDSDTVQHCYLQQILNQNQHYNNAVFV